MALTASLTLLCALIALRALCTLSLLCKELLQQFHQFVEATSALATLTAFSTLCLHVFDFTLKVSDLLIKALVRLGTPSDIGTSAHATCARYSVYTRHICSLQTNKKMGRSALPINP
nr:hypothetical protein [uncultured Pseudomonas sp.]